MKTKHVSLAISFILSLFLFTSIALGATVTTELRNGENGYTGTQDTYVREALPNDNFGGESGFRADGDNGGEDLAFISWDLSSIPTDAVLQSAVIRFDVFDTTTGSYELLEMSGSWDEDTLTWNTLNTGDIGTTALATITSPPTGTLDVTLNATALTLITEWIDGTTTNNGFALQSTGTTDGIVMSSSEKSTGTKRPRLSLTYTTNTTTDTFQEGVAGYTGTEDTYVHESDPTSTHGSESGFRADGQKTVGGGVGEDIGFVTWDISSIPSNATVLWAKIDFEIYDGSAGTYDLFEMQETWDEATLNWNNLNTANIGSTSLAGIPSTTPGPIEIVLNSTGLNVLQDWIDGTATNYGFAIRSAGTYDGITFNSSEKSIVDTRPRLTVRYNTQAQQVAPVTFNPNGGTFVGNVSVTLSTTTAGADIYYTLDGSTPTTSSTLYTGAISLGAATEVNAFAVKSGLTDSDVTSAEFIRIPEDPALVANDIDNTLLYDVGKNSEFLYTGSDPIQTGVDPMDIDAVRASVIRGQVLQLDMNAADPANAPPIPLGGATVTILGHDDPADPEYYGQTVTRADGFYDMAVNGGGQLTVNVKRSGYLPSQRKVEVPWHDFAVVENMLLMEKDPNATVINLSTITEATEARGSVVTDVDGTRQATVLFLPGTTAERVYEDGTKEDISSQITVHATEYTVGDNGPMAMPALLPGTSAYTYMVNFTVDEAESVGAPFVEFSQPVYGYVENFLDVKAGQVVPNGYYDRVQGKWIPEDNGLVVKIMSIDTTGTTPIAELDLDGDNDHDNDDDTLETTYNFSTEELEKLASLYQAGDSMWRVPMEHFSDWNYPIAVVIDAILDVSAEEGKTVNENVSAVCDICKRSTIQVQGQIYGEEVAIPGTPFTLHYNSDRVRGTKTGATLDIPLIDSRLNLGSSSIVKIHLTVDVAGVRKTEVFDRVSGNSIPDITPTLVHRFEWDGLDAYGRDVVGVAGAKITIGYEYPTAEYGAPAQFATPSPSVKLEASDGVSNVLSRTNVIFSQSYIKQVNVNDFRPLGLGGWTVDANHVYEFFSPGLHLGPGPRRTTKTLNTAASIFADTQSGGVTFPDWLDVDSVGNVFFATNCHIWKADLSGNITDIMGLNGPNCTGPPPLSGDGQLARNQPLINVRGLDVDDEGNIYFYDADNTLPLQPVIGKIDTSGILHIILGGNDRGFSGEGGPSINAQVNALGEMVVDKEGNIYLADSENNRIRKIDTAGIITTVAGNGNQGSSGMTNTQLGHEGPATDFTLGKPNYLTIDSKGNLYAASSHLKRIIKIDTNGIATVLVGSHHPLTDPFLEGVEGSGRDQFLIPFNFCSHH